MDLLKLTLPAQSEQNEEEKITVKQLQSWLDDLPQVNIAGAFAQIHQELYRLNRQPLPPSLRIDLQTAIEGNVKHLKLHLQPEDYKKDPALKSEVRQYLHEKIFTYKIITQDTEENPRKLGHKKFIQQTITGTIEALCDYSLFYFNDYQKLPIQLWKEATLLYRYAQHKGLDLDNTSGKYSTGMSLNQTYQIFAILRLSDPYQIQPGTIWALFEYFKSAITDKVILDSGESIQSTQSPIVIDKGPSINECDLSIDINPLYAQVESDIDILANNTDGKLNNLLTIISRESLQQTLTRVLSSLSSQLDRKSDRVHIHQRFEVAIGISACCHLMQSNAETNTSLSCEETVVLSSESEPLPSSQNFRAHLCSSINKNAGGLAIRIDSKELLPIHVGQIVGIHRPGTTMNQGWVMGVCRWLTHHGNQGALDLGIQYLTQNAVAASLSQKTLPALSSNQKQGNQQISTLITSAGIYKENRGLELQINGEMQSISCQQLVEATTLFERFTYTTASKVASIDTSHIAMQEKNGKTFEVESE